MVNGHILCVVVVAVDDIDLLACFLFKFSEFCGNCLMLGNIVSAVSCKVAGNKHKLTFRIFRTFLEKFVNYESALIGERFAFGIKGRNPTLIRKSGSRLLYRVDVMSIRRNGESEFIAVVFG